jgi:sugar phosphate isomerase/epimerase
MERKEFLKMAALGSSTFLFENAFAMNAFNTELATIKNFGIQLWTVRDFMIKDAKATIKSLAKYGYKSIESFDGDKGIFWGMKPKEFKAFLTQHNLTIKASHCGMDKKFEQKVEDAASIGMEYLIYPYEGDKLSIDDYKKLAEDFNKKGEYLKKMGLKLAFHNHDFTFRKLEGQFAQDVLMQNTQADLVFYEMDIYWVVTAGQSPIEWLKKYPNRFKSCHIKDRMKNVEATNTSASCVVGTGTIDFKKILKVAKQNGMKHFFVEQERYDEGTSMECAKMDASYMKKLKI